MTFLNDATTYSIVNANTGFQIGGTASTGHYLRGNGTDYIDSSILVGDLPTTNLTVSSSLSITSGSGTGAVLQALNLAINTSWVGQTSITTLGTITAGTWNATILGLAYGGTGSDLHLTGGTGQYLKQSSAGAAITVGTIAAADLPGSFGGFANPSASVGLTTVNGSATTAMRSDAAPSLSQAITPTWTGLHTFNGNISGTQGANGDNTLKLIRNTNTAPTGNFLYFRNSGDTSTLFSVDITGAITANTISVSSASTLTAGAGLTGTTLNALFTAATLAVDTTYGFTWTGLHTFSKDVGINQGANGDNVIKSVRNTDTSPTGNFLYFRNHADNATVFEVDVNGEIVVGTGSAGVSTGNDTNVTLNSSYSANPVLSALTISAGWTGQLAISRGGTGQSTANAALNALLPSQTGNTSKILTTDGTNTSWGAAGSGTVTSVGLSVPTQLSVSGSPITSSGTLAVSWVNQNINLVFASPASVGAGVPTFRSLVAADLPAFDTFSPLTTKGDLLTYSTTNTRLAVGTDGYVLMASSGQTTGLEWTNEIQIDKTNGRIGLLGATNTSWNAYIHGSCYVNGSFGVNIATNTTCRTFSAYIPITVGASTYYVPLYL